MKRLVSLRRGEGRVVRANIKEQVGDSIDHRRALAFMLKQGAIGGL